MTQNETEKNKVAICLYPWVTNLNMSLGREEPELMKKTQNMLEK